VKRSFSLAGHRTSVALEEEFWTVLLRMARTRRQSLSALVAAVDATREPGRPLASALRVTALLANAAGSSQFDADQPPERP
jgi:predicted DNA-binding ribbon-helix-helix protein